MRVAGDEEGNGDGGKSDGDGVEGGGEYGFSVLYCSAVCGADLK
jgi:hypothetical protein